MARSLLSDILCSTSTWLWVRSKCCCFLGRKIFVPETLTFLIFSVLCFLCTSRSLHKLGLHCQEHPHLLLTPLPPVDNSPLVLSLLKGLNYLEMRLYRHGQEVSELFHDILGLFLDAEDSNSSKHYCYYGTKSGARCSTNIPCMGCLLLYILPQSCKDTLFYVEMTKISFDISEPFILTLLFWTELYPILVSDFEAETKWLHF